MNTVLRLALLASFVGLSVLGCDRPRPAPETAVEEELPPSPFTATRGYVLISVDTLRADHLGSYGYGRDTSPFLDSLAERGALFERHVVQLPGTLPSHMSIFTGLYPAEHGVYPPDGVLSETIATLPEIFQAAGFSTGGFTEGGYMDGSYGFRRGFDEFNDRMPGGFSAKKTFASGLDFVRGLGEDEPFFLFLHTYAVHDPYKPKEPYRGLFWQGPTPDTFEPTGPNLAAANRGELQSAEDPTEYFKALYDASIRQLDDELKHFFTELETLVPAGQVTVAVTSDHGEEFQEHGLWAHEQAYPETLKVPLIVLHPEIEGPLRVSQVTESIDLAPTLYHLAGLDGPRGSGSSLLPQLQGVETSPSDAYAESFQTYVRTLLHRGEDGYHQLRIEPVLTPDKIRWQPQEMVFDLPPGRHELRAQSFHRDRRLEIRVDGTPMGAVNLGHRLKTSFTIDVPATDGRALARVSLRGDSCDVVSEVIDNPDSRCLSFRLYSPKTLRRFELFDLEQDPTAQENRHDLAPSLLRPLAKRLLSKPVPSAKKSSARELDPELEERLRSLGYLS